MNKERRHFIKTMTLGAGGNDHWFSCGFNRKYSENK